MSEEIFPRVIKTDTPTVVKGFPPLCTVRIVPKAYPLRAEYSSSDESGCLKICLPSEGEYFLDTEPDGIQYAGRYAVFALSGDMCGFLPFQGDFHIHTSFSDGKQTPETMVHCGRLLGLDFMAVADHDNYDGSQAAKEYGRHMGYNMLFLSGEEISVPGGGHLLSIGATSPLHLKKLNPEELNALIAERAAEIKQETLMPDVLPHEIAPVIWTAEAIKKRGGMTVLCHPMWVVKQTGYFHLRRNIFIQVLVSSLVDAVEIPAHSQPEDNMLALNIYNSIDWKGKPMPRLANSDAHDSTDHTYGHRRVVVLSRSNTQTDIFDAIYENRCAACEERPGSALQIHGGYRMAEYAYFLFREYFPTKNHMAAEEADLISFGKDISENLKNADNFIRAFFSDDVRPLHRSI